MIKASFGMYHLTLPLATAVEAFSLCSSMEKEQELRARVRARQEQDKSKSTGVIVECTEDGVSGACSHKRT